MLFDFTHYQKRAGTTAIYPTTYVSGEHGVPNPLGLVYPALGLAGEAGEFANKVKKIIRDDHGVVTEPVRMELAKELGDILWYVAACATELDLDLQKCAKENLKKLAARKRRNTLGGSGDNR